MVDERVTVIARVPVRLGISPVYHVFVVRDEFRRFQRKTLAGHFVVSVLDLLVQEHLVVRSGLRVFPVHRRDGLDHQVFAYSSFLQNKRRVRVQIS